MLNVNVPDTAGAPVPGFKWAPAGDREYGHIVTVRHDPRRRPYYWLGGERLTYHPMPGSDCDTVAAGLASITPLDLDLTSHALLDALRDEELLSEADTAEAT